MMARKGIAMLLLIALSTVSLFIIITGVIYMSAALELLEERVADIGVVVDSAIDLITTIAQEVRDCAASSDIENSLNVLANSLDEKAAALAGAVAANTVAADEEEEEGEDPDVAT